MPFTEEFTAFLNVDEHATAAIFSRSGETVNVIFDAAYVDPLGMESSGPRAWGAAADFASVIHGDTLTISSIAYKIINTEPDGTGGMVLKLRKPT